MVAVGREEDDEGSVSFCSPTVLAPMIIICDPFLPSAVFPRDIMSWKARLRNAASSLLDVRTHDRPRFERPKCPTSST